MTIQISQEHNEFRLDGTLRFLNRASLIAPYCNIYAGIRAESVYHAAPTSPLVRFALQTPAGYVSDGVLYLLPLQAEMVLITGTPTWARFYNGLDQVALDCHAGYGQGFWEVELDKEVLYAGGYAAMVLTRVM